MIDKNRVREGPVATHIIHKGDCLDILNCIERRMNPTFFGKYRDSIVDLDNIVYIKNV